MNSLDSKRPLALVTGASSGIGEEFAHQLAQKGYDLIVAARRQERLLALKEKLEKKYAIAVFPIVTDLNNPQSIEELAQKSFAIGEVSALVNNAGMGHYGYFLDHSVDEQLQNVDLNVRAIVHLTHLVSAQMKRHQKASWVINVASVAAFCSPLNYVVYGASKAFVRSFSETLRLELKDEGIKVLCLAPGGTATEFLDKAGQNLKSHGQSFMMSAQEVVAQALLGLEKNKALVVPGVTNRLAQLLCKILPYSWCVQIFSASMRLMVDKQKARS